MTFDDLALAEPILRAVTAEGYETPTPIQAESIPHVIADRDVLGSAQTGTGKTAAFALPILHKLFKAGKPAKLRGRAPRALILSPTRELAAQIGDSFRTYGNFTPLRGTVVFGGVGQSPQVKALRNGIDVLVATPGRLQDLYDQGHVNLGHIEMFVLDEADHMLDMGFIPAIRKIISYLPAKRQNLLFSATMPREIKHLADSILRDPVRVAVAPVSSSAETVAQSLYKVSSKRQKPTLLSHVLANESTERVLVFTRTKHGADRVARHLFRSGIEAEAIHGDKTQAARQRALKNFRACKIHVLVATDVAARGLDIDNVSHVINYDVPHVPETYIHRIGRTGRAGAEGVAISFCDPEERSFVRSIQRLTGVDLEIRDDHPEYPAGSEQPIEKSDGRSQRSARGQKKSRPRHPMSKFRGDAGNRDDNGSGRPRRSGKPRTPRHKRRSKANQAS